MQAAQVQIQKYVPSTSLTFLVKGAFVSIPYPEIIRIWKRDRKCFIITNGGEYPAPFTLERLLKELPVNSFARVQKSHILSLEHLDLLGKQVPTTAYYKDQLKIKLARLLEQRYRFMISRWQFPQNYTGLYSFFKIQDLDIKFSSIC